MEDLHTSIWRLSDLDRVPLIEALIRMDATAQATARGRGSRARRGTMERYRVEQASDDSDTLGRIIYFLRFRSPATHATAADLALCDELAEKLRAKGQWQGEYSR